MLTYSLEKRGDKPRYLYLYNEIKKDIIAGKIKSGEKMPSKRALAEHLGTSVITVENAYAVLADEGYIYSLERSGYFVCDIHSVSARTSAPSPATAPIKDEIISEEIDFSFCCSTKVKCEINSGFRKKVKLNSF